MKQARNAKGFSLVELLACLLLISSVVWIAITGWINFLASNQATITLNRLISLIDLARSEAIKRGQVIGVCASADKHHCQSNWSQGQLVFIDRLNKGIINSTTDILYAMDFMVGRGYIQWRGFGRENILQILPNGFTSMQNGTFVYCPSNRNNHLARAIIINKTGRMRLSKDADGDGIDEDAQGRPLTCN